MIDTKPPPSELTPGVISGSPIEYSRHNLWPSGHHPLVPALVPPKLPQSRQNLHEQGEIRQINSTEYPKENPAKYPNKSLPQSTDAPSTKRKRGRPKKLIMDPATNSYIDLSHPHFKVLNKQLKPLLAKEYQMEDGSTHMTSQTHSVLKCYDQDQVKELLQKKDRRGRPRKFPIELTGVTIKGIRINGAKKRKLVS